MKVMKFGGVSVANANNILHVAGLITRHAKQHDTIVVVSAVKGVTDELFRLYEYIEEKNTIKLNESLQAIQFLHTEIANNLEIKEQYSMQCYRDLDMVYMSLQSTVARLLSKNKLSHADQDALVTYGEKLSATLVSHAVRKHRASVAIDSMNVIACTLHYGNARAKLPETEQQANLVLQPLIDKGFVPIVTGFYGGTNQNTVATLGRGGSDYSAAILAAVMNADELIIWKEVNGVYTEDPKVVKTAEFLPHISYEFAYNLAKNGAKVLHPETMNPVRDRNIPIRVKNTFQPELSGTLIS